MLDRRDPAACNTALCLDFTQSSRAHWFMDVHCIISTEAVSF